MPARLKFALSLSFCLILLSEMAAGQDTLHDRVDQLVEANQVGPLAPLSNDAEFLRRVYLDLTGAIPTAAEARTFLDDASPAKRQALVDVLLASPRYPVHMATTFDVMLMERRPDKHVPSQEWQKYLQECFSQNRPFDQLAREILSADGTDPATRPAAKFFLDRDAEPDSSSRDVGRMFFGMDMQCAQCHDHPLVDHYLQADYYGLLAFVNRTELFNDAAAKKMHLAERSSGDTSYKSVFTGDAASTRPQLPGGMEIDEPRYRQGEDYVAAPAPNVRAVPKYSRRAKLAELATNGTNRQFNVNIANRLWAIVMGRGLVHPVDLHHPANPPSHPAVLDLITSEFVAHKYDMRWLIREIVLTRTYQRSIDPPQDLSAQVATATQQVPAVESEWNRLKAVAEESRKQSGTALDELKAARTAAEPAAAAWKKAEAAVSEAKKPVDAAAAAVVKAQADATSKQGVLSTVNDAVAKSGEVAKALPNDKEVAAAVATFTARQQQITTELTAIQKTITDQSAAQQAAQAKLVEAYVPADAAYAAMVEANKPVNAAKLKMLEIWARHQSDSVMATVQKKRFDALQSHVAFGTAMANVAPAQAAIEPARNELAAATMAVQQQQAEIEKQVVAVAEVEKALADQTKQLEAAKVQQTEKQSVVQVVSEAVAKSEAALQKLPGDADLVAVVQKLKDKQDPLAKEAILLQQAVVSQDAGLKETTTRMAGLKQTLAAANGELSNRQQAVGVKTAAVDQAVTNLQAAHANVSASRAGLIDVWTSQGGLRALKHLNPEQMGWAVMQATGVLEPQRPGADAEIEKTSPKAAVAADPAAARNRDLQIEALLHERNRGNLGSFISIYGQSAGQPQDDFFATPDQALFVANGGSVVGWAAGGQLAQRLIPMEDPRALAEELYLSVLTRRPLDSEMNDVIQQLAARPTEKGTIVRDMIWALVTSVEFRFNH